MLAVHRIALFVTALSALAVLPGCGFQLRGGELWPVELAPAYIEGQQRRSQLVEQLSLELRRREVVIATSAAAASGIVSVLDEQFDQRALTVGTDGKPREFELAYTVTFAGRRQAELLLQPTTVTLTRIYAYDPTTILAKQREAEKIREDLREEMALRILQRFSHLQTSTALDADAVITEPAAEQ